MIWHQDINCLEILTAVSLISQLSVIQYSPSWNSTGYPSSLHTWAYNDTSRQTSCLQLSVRPIISNSSDTALLLDHKKHYERHLDVRVQCSPCSQLWKIRKFEGPSVITATHDLTLQFKYRNLLPKIQDQFRTFSVSSYTLHVDSMGVSNCICIYCTILLSSKWARMKSPRWGPNKSMLYWRYWTWQLKKRHKKCVSGASQIRSE